MQLSALPEQAPSQYRKTLPLVGTCVSVTLVLSAYALLQVPLVAAWLRVHETPVGALLIVPPPSDPDAADIARVGGAANCAVTAAVAPVTMVVVQVLPLQAPVYPENDARPVGVAVSVTTVLAGKVLVQVPPSRHMDRL